MYILIIAFAIMIFLILFFKGYKWYKKKMLQKAKKTSAIRRVRSKLKAL